MFLFSVTMVHQHTIAQSMVNSKGIHIQPPLTRMSHDILKVWLTNILCQSPYIYSVKRQALKWQNFLFSKGRRHLTPIFSYCWPPRGAWSNRLQWLILTSHAYQLAMPLYHNITVLTVMKPVLDSARELLSTIAVKRSGLCCATRIATHPPCRVRAILGNSYSIT